MIETAAAFTVIVALMAWWMLSSPDDPWPFDFEPPFNMDKRQ